MSDLRWKWWAGDNEDEYHLAGPCLTRRQAIGEAYGDTEPGDEIFLIEAVSESECDIDGLFQFVETRNRSSVIRKEDPPLWVYRLRWLLRRAFAALTKPARKDAQ